MLKKSRLSVSIAMLGCLTLLPPLAYAAPPLLKDAAPGDVRLFVSGALRAPVATVTPQLDESAGHNVVAQVSESRVLQKAIEDGQPFEVALLTRPVIDDLIGKGRIVPGSRVDLATVRVGVSVRGNPPALDISTAQGLKQAILAAHSIRRFYGLGASVPTLDKLFSSLDLNEITKDKIVALGAGQATPEAALGAGEYELIINLVSEVIPMKDWKYLGLIPEQFQVPVYMSAGVGTLGNAEAAKKVIAVLKSPAFASSLEAYGMTRN
jgi:molybdate transport system substrate-binding protein